MSLPSAGRRVSTPKPLFPDASSTPCAELIMADLEAMMSKVQCKKCEFVDLVRQQINRLNDREIDFNNRSGCSSGWREHVRENLWRYVACAAACLFLLFLLYSLVSSCCDETTTGRRCWLFATNLFLYSQARPNVPLHSTF